MDLNSTGFSIAAISLRPSSLHAMVILLLRKSLTRGLSLVPYSPSLSVARSAGQAYKFGDFSHILNDGGGAKPWSCSSPVLSWEDLVHPLPARPPLPWAAHRAGTDDGPLHRGDARDGGQADARQRPRRRPTCPSAASRCLAASLKFQGAQLDVPLCKLIDTPGILSGEKRGSAGADSCTCAAGSRHAATSSCSSSTHKLDIDEFKNAIGRQGLRRQDPRRAEQGDAVEAQKLIRIYGALMWSLGKVVKTPSACASTSAPSGTSCCSAASGRGAAAA